MNKIEFWSLDPVNKKYIKTENQPLSVFPTIVNPAKKTVYCKRCHRWEYIIGFKNNILISQCGSIYKPPFVPENVLINYGYHVRRMNDMYIIDVKSQGTVLKDRKTYSSQYILNMNEKVLYKDGKSVFTNEDLAYSLCKEITDEIIEEMAEKYKLKFGIKPTVASKFKGFNLIIGYMLAPFNINFYKIAHHWGLNPYNKEFANLSSGDTPTAENEMFESMDIKPTKTVRKLYQQNPESVICYAAAKDLGITDVNILQKSYSKEFYNFLSFNNISFAGGILFYPLQEYLKAFCTDILRISNQKTLWNSLERTFKYFYQSRNSYLVTDGITSYTQCNEHLTDTEKKDIMSEGFNNYTHDFLIRRIHQLNPDTSINGENGKAPVNLLFDIEPKFMDLEYKAGDEWTKKRNPATGEEEYVKVEDKDRYCFYVAKDSFTLRTIGAEMHNCVGWGYANSVFKRHCTIVYAMHKGKYRICIEVTPDFSIRQALGPCNHPLQGDDLVAYAEWCKINNIQFKKAFRPYCAQ